MFKLNFYIPFLGLLASCIFASCGGNEEARAWQQVLNSPSIPTIDSFLAKYPNGSYREAALQRKEDFLWHAAKSENTEYAYKRYQKEYPQGKFIDQVQPSMEAIPTDNISLQELTSKTFVGTINYGNKEISVLSMRFTKIEEDSLNGIRFEAIINTDELRKNLTGYIDKSKYIITFQENQQDEVLFNLTNGRAYIRDSQLILESIDVSQHWSLK